MKLSTFESETSAGEKVMLASGEKRDGFGGGDSGDTGWEYTRAVWSREGEEEDVDVGEEIEREQRRKKGAKSVKEFIWLVCWLFYLRLNS